MKLLLFDLDGTLLRSDKTISGRTLEALRKSREKGCLIGVSTSRSEQNCMEFLPKLMPDVFISSGGALVKCGEKSVYTAEFTEEETRAMIRTAREICGADCEITIDTQKAHYWNYKVDPTQADTTWGDPVYTDYTGFRDKALKFCVEVFESGVAERLAQRLPDCDCIRFSGSAWYKFTKKEATKENAIKRACKACSIPLENVIAFGDDLPDIGMLKLCGTGVAMGNAVEAVKAAADIVIGSNDEDGIAAWLESI